MKYSRCKPTNFDTSSKEALDAYNNFLSKNGGTEFFEEEIKLLVSRITDIRYAFGAKLSGKTNEITIKHVKDPVNPEKSSIVLSVTDRTNTLTITREKGSIGKTDFSTIVSLNVQGGRYRIYSLPKGKLSEDKKTKLQICFENSKGNSDYMLTYKDGSDCISTLCGLYLNVADLNVIYTTSKPKDKKTRRIRKGANGADDINGIMTNRGGTGRKFNYR